MFWDYYANRFVAPETQCKQRCMSDSKCNGISWASDNSICVLCTGSMTKTREDTNEVWRLWDKSPSNSFILKISSKLCFWHHNHDTKILIWHECLQEIDILVSVLIFGNFIGKNSFLTSLYKVFKFQKWYQSLIALCRTTFP